VRAKFLLVLCLLSFTGCHYLNRQYDASQGRNVVLVAEKQEKSRELTSATVDSLSLIPESDKTLPIQLAEFFAKENQLLVGLPVEPINIASLIQQSPETIELFLNQVKDENTNLRKKLRDSEAEMLNLQAQLAELGKKYEREKNKSIWNRVRASLGMTGIIALVVIFPVLIPIFTNILAAIIRAVPQLMSVLGLAAKKTVENIVSGVQHAKSEIRTSPKKTFTKDEVIEILNRNSKEEQDKTDVYTVNYIKNK